MCFHQLFVGGAAPLVNGFIWGQWEKEHLEMIYVMLQLLPRIELPWCSTSKTQIAFQPLNGFGSVFSTNEGASTRARNSTVRYLSASFSIPVPYIYFFCGSFTEVWDIYKASHIEGENIRDLHVLRLHNSRFNFNITSPLHRNITF